MKLTITSIIFTMVEHSNSFTSNIYIQGQEFEVEYNKDTAIGISFELVSEEHRVGIVVPSFAIKEFIDGSVAYFERIVGLALDYLDEQIRLIDTFKQRYSGDYN